MSILHAIIAANLAVAAANLLLLPVAASGTLSGWSERKSTTFLIGVDAIVWSAVFVLCWSAGQ